MNRYRKQTWFPVLSVLLLAVFVQSQIAGCCTWGSRLLQSKSAAVRDQAPVPSAGMDHACCPKAAQESAPAAASAAPDCHAKSADHGCCLQGADLNPAGIASIASESTAPLAMPAFSRVLERLSVSHAPYADLALLDSGPPASGPQLPLLI